jgi:protoporphyrin/coproporphyrin ferrochelatase
VTTLAPDAGVLLMTYGSPDSLAEDDVAAYLARVRGGRAADPELVSEFTRRYRVIGGSPLIEITRRQAAALSARLGRPARAAMRFSEPSIEAGLRGLQDAGARHAVAIILSPQHSPMLMGGYANAIDEARARIGPEAPRVTIAGEWWTERAFVQALAARIRDKTDPMSETERAALTVLLTAHSLPRRVAEQEPAYVDQLRCTAAAVAEAASLSQDRWQFCWQSAGHEPGEWMTPDLKDLVVDLAAAGRRSILVVPVQFLADHLEVLYDIDVGAREQAEAAGAAFDRIDALNDDPALIEAFVHVAETTAGRRGN